MFGGSGPIEPGELRATRHSRLLAFTSKFAGAVAFIYVLALMRSSTVLSRSMTGVGDLYVGLAFALAAVAGTVLFNRRRRLAEGVSVVIEQACLCFRAEEDLVKKVPLSEVAEGYFDGAGTLTFKLNDGRQFDVGCPEQEAEALLQQAGLDTERRALHLPLANASSRVAYGPATTLVVGLVAAVFSVTLTMGAMFAIIEGWALEGAVWAPAWIGSSVLWWLMRRLDAPHRITIGMDGIEVARAFGSRHVPMRDIEGLEEEDDGLALVLGDGSRIVLREHGGSPWTGDPEEAAAARRTLARRIHESITRGHAADLSVDQLRRLERGGRSAEAWTLAMLELANTSDRYRERHISRDQLARVVADAGLIEQQRIGAALALSNLRDEHWDVIEATALATASPRFLRALRAAAQGVVDEAAFMRIESVEHVEEDVASEVAAEAELLDGERRSADRHL